MSWYCHCGILNSGLNIQCAAIREPRFGNEHYQISNNTPDLLMAIVASKEVDATFDRHSVSLTRHQEGKEMTSQEELFSKFYNHEKILVKDMDIPTLREHREQLSTIAFEAKARLVATDDESRERKAKSGNKEWLVTSLESDQVTSDAINAVKVRSARMSKMDKLRQQLLTAGIDEELANEMVRNLESKATESVAKTITFKSDKAKAPVVIKVSEPIETKPFNPSSLSFLKKE